MIDVDNKTRKLYNEITEYFEHSKQVYCITNETKRKQ